MKTIILSLVLIGTAAAQSRQMVLCDSQPTKNCYTWDIGANLGSSSTITGPILPLAGGAMTGLITLNPSYGNALLIPTGGNIEANAMTGSLQSPANCTSPPAWSGSTTYGVGDIAVQSGTTYTSIINSNLNHMPPNASYWTPACVDDRTRVDGLGMEGDFVRIKGKGSAGGVTIGDYFDWTRFSLSTSNSLPVHQLNLADSSGNAIVHIDEASDYHKTTFDFSGEVRLGLNTSVDVGITRNNSGILEINNGVPLASAGTAGQLRALGLLVNQDNDSSGYQIQSNGGIEMTSTANNIYSKGTSLSALRTDGGVQVGTSGYLRYSGGQLQGSNDGSSFFNLNSSGIWTRNAGGFVYPTTTTDGVYVGRTSDNGSGAILQVQGYGWYNAGLLVSQLNDGSGYSVQINGGEEIAGSSNTLFLKDCTAANCINVAHGGVTSSTDGTNGGYWVGSNQVITGSRVITNATISIGSSGISAGNATFSGNVSGTWVGTQTTEAATLSTSVTLAATPSDLISTTAPLTGVYLVTYIVAYDGSAGGTFTTDIVSAFVTVNGTTQTSSNCTMSLVYYNNASNAYTMCVGNFTVSMTIGDTIKLRASASTIGGQSVSAIGSTSNLGDTSLSILKI